MADRRGLRYIAAMALLAAVVIAVVIGRYLSSGSSPQRPPAVARETPAATPPETAEVPRPALTPTRITARTHRPGARTTIPRLLPATTGRAALDPTPAGP